MTDTMRNLRSEAVDFLHKHGDLTFSAAYAAVDKLCSNGFYITRTPTPDPRDAVIARLVEALESIIGQCSIDREIIANALAAAKEVMK